MWVKGHLGIDTLIILLKTYKNIYDLVTDSGDLYTWGTGSDGQTGTDVEEMLAPEILKFSSRAIWVACGYYHTAVVTGKQSD